MSKSKSETEKRVDLYLQDLSLTNMAIYELLQAIRNQILGVELASNETVKEEVKYGGILFAVEQAFCGVFAYANHVSLEFGEGASLPDQFNVLEGKGKFRRHIKLTSTEEIESKHVMHYVKLACQHLQTS
jgi:hypothetical protein